MTDRNSNELSPDDWNYRHDEQPEPSKLGALSGLVLLVLGMLLSAWLMFTGSPLPGLIVLATGFGLMVLLSGQGGMMLEDVKQSIESEASTPQQQQQQTGTSNQVCTECGWQNPPKNDYCHDCGGELSS